MLFFIICVLAIISLGILVTVRTKPVRAHAPMNAPAVEEPIEQPTPPTDPTPPILLDASVLNPPKFQTSGQTTMTQTPDQPEVIVNNLKMSAKPKRKYNKKKGTNPNQFKNKK